VSMTTPRRRGPGSRPLALVSLLVGAATAIVTSAVAVSASPEPDPVTVAEAADIRPVPPRTPVTGPAEAGQESEAVADGAERAQTVAGSDPDGARHAEEAAPAPTGVRIPVLGVEAPMIDLGLEEDRRLEVPQDADVTGWWTGGSAPGERGPAVVVGHVDSYEGPGVFFRLAELEPGDHVTIDREDGTSVTYAVQRAEWHRKDAFPTEDVYGATDEATMRLVTCGGEFDPDARSYEENLVVFLELVGWS
jgi:sortase (surface protein transpeptidase)